LSICSPSLHDALPIFLDVELDVHNRSGFWSVCHDHTFGPVEAAGVFNAVREGSRKVRGPTEIHEERYFFVVVRSCEDGAVSPGRSEEHTSELQSRFDL